MERAQLPPDEAGRLKELRAYGILDTPAEPAFDDITRLASYICGTPMSAVSLIDEQRQWFKSRVGVDDPETSRDVSFCSHAILRTGTFVVTDAAADPRFADNPLVTGSPNIRFYAGAPLRTPSGHALGTLCVLDREPKQLTAEQLDMLAALARQATDQLERRRKMIELQQLVSARDRAEWEARESASRLEQILNALAVGVFVVDSGGRPAFVNAAAAALLGRGVADVDAHGLADAYQAVVAGTDRPYPTADLVARLLQGQHVEVDDVEIVRPEGRRLLQACGMPIRETSGTVVAAAASFRDVTEQRRAEVALRHSEARSRSIIENMHGALVTVDDGGRIESLNPAASRIFGYPAAELVGQPLDAIVAQRSGSVLAALRAAAATASIIAWEGRRRSGEAFPIELTLFAFETADDRRWAINALDVSARREVERLKQEFVSTVSHELRTPLTSIRGSLGLIASGALGELPSEAREVVGIAERNAVRLIALINDILDLERLETGNVELALRDEAIGSIIERAREAVHAVADRENIAIQTPHTAARVSIDPDRVVQVLVNLLSNAIKFSPRGSTVAIDVVEDDGWVTVQVKDRGRGIPAAHQHAVFERFRQVESSDAREKGGTGLGLAICRSIVERHGGTIGVESAEGAGSTFWFRLPRTPRPSGPVAVLLAGPDDRLRAYLTDLLQRSGYGVQAVQTDDEAWDALQPGAVRIVVLAGGAALAERIRRTPELSDLPVLVCGTSALLPADALGDGLVIYLPDTAGDHEILEAIRRRIGGGPEPAERAHVLIVEDDVFLVQVLERQLHNAGIATHAVGTGREAIASARRTAPSLIVLDVALPDGDGFDVVDALRRDDVLRHTPVLVYTGRDLTGEQRRRLTLGRTRFLTKSTHSDDEFRRIVQDLRASRGAREDAS